MNDRQFQIAAYSGCAVLFALLLWLRFSGEPTPPRKPLPPSRPQAADVAALNYSTGLYRATLEKDSAQYGVPRATPEELSQPFAHESVDLQREVVPDEAPVETATLRLSARVADVEMRTAQGSYTGPHLILKIENKTDRYLAYRVDTAPTSVQRCMSKGDLPHDAIALAPGEAVERSECAWRDGMKLFVERVETITLPALSYYYVSRLYPPHVGMDARATRGHVPAKGQVCNDIPEQTIRRGMQKGDVTWRDVIDFYARHNCEAFIFPPGYRAFERPNQYVLPVSREAAAAGGGGGAPPTGVP